MRRVAALAVFCALTLPSAAMPGNGDRSLQTALRYVRAACGRNAGPVSRMWMAEWAFNALYGNCKAGDGSDQHIWFFFRGRFVGTDATQPSRQIVGIWRDDRTVAFMYVLYRSSDPNCCPTGGGKIVRFRWTGKRVVALDRLPPSGSATGAKLTR